MKRLATVIAYIAGGTLSVAHATAAHAEDTIPRWDVAEICATSTLGARCPAVESRHRRAVFNRWQTVPVADRTACEAAVMASGQRSYRALLTCLEGQQLRAIEQTPKSSDQQSAPNLGQSS